MPDFFRRFRVPDVAALLREIAEDEAVLAKALAGGDEDAESFQRMKLGFDFIPLDREAEAAAQLERALMLSRKLGNQAREIEILLYLGTARQYLGERETAMALFDEGLEKARATGIGEQVHFLLHHRGRCEVEMMRFADARSSFEQALALRQKLGLARAIESSRAALKEVEGL